MTVDGVPGHRFVVSDPQEFNERVFVVREGRGVAFGVSGRDATKGTAPGHLKDLVETVRWTPCK